VSSKYIHILRYSPETQCKKMPREVCGPGPCPIEPGPKECRQESRTVTQDVPEETCDLQPQKVCKFVTKLVPVYDNYTDIFGYLTANYFIRSG